MSRPVAVISGLVGPGVLILPLVPRCIIGAFPVAVGGTRITPHGNSPHSPVPFLIPSQFRVLARGIPLCRAGDIASCGHVALPGPNFTVLCF